MQADYNERIPNNVGLADDRRLLRALERWQPAYLDWWRALGPVGADEHAVYLRTAIGVDSDGWAHFGHVRMPDYRWGIFLAEPEADRRINFGIHKGEPAWQALPGEYRAELRRLIVTQGDTEPASVEQQCRLGLSAPSLYDLRNLYQVNVEEGRHLWAMVYLLHAYFGRDGREEAEEMLARHAGDADKPRTLEAFNEPTDDWLSFFMYTFFQDRDGKYQLHALAESGFDPLSRTCRFMLTEEAHHMFVGETGVMRIVQRTCEKMREHDTDDVGPYGAVPLALLQKWVNFHYSICLDLFGSEESTNAANYYSMGIKGRYHETRIDDDHVLAERTVAVPAVDGGRLAAKEVTALKAMNETLRNAYVDDSQRGHRPLQQGDPRLRHRRRAPPAAPRLPPQHRRLRRHPCGARRHARRRGDMGGEAGRVAAERGRPRLRRIPDAPGDRARRDGRLDRSSQARHPRPAARLPLRRVPLVTWH